MYYLSIPTFSASFHLAVVFGVVSKESCLAVTELHHAAKVWVVFTVMAEELPTVHISANVITTTYSIFALIAERDEHAGCAVTHSLWQGINRSFEGRLQKA